MSKYSVNGIRFESCNLPNKLSLNVAKAVVMELVKNWSSGGQNKSLIENWDELGVQIILWDEQEWN